MAFWKTLEGTYLGVVVGKGAYPASPAVFKHLDAAQPFSFLCAAEAFHLIRVAREEKDKKKERPWQLRGGPEREVTGLIYVSGAAKSGKMNCTPPSVS